MLGDFIYNANTLVFAYFRTFASGVIVIYWAIGLFIPKKHRKTFEISSLFGHFFNWLLYTLFCCKYFTFFRVFSKIPFNYPLKIKAGALLASGICIASFIITLISGYSIYNTINNLKSYLAYLEIQPPFEIFMIIRLETTYKISVVSGKELLKISIDLLETFYPCLVISATGGLLISFFSIYSLFYVYKKMILEIREQGQDSDLLEHIWKVKSYNSIYFCTQFATNCFILNAISAVFLFTLTYVISLNIFQSAFVHFFFTRSPGFWISFFPVVLG